MHIKLQEDLDFSPLNLIPMSLMYDHEAQTIKIK